MLGLNNDEHQLWNAGFVEQTTYGSRSDEKPFKSFGGMGDKAEPGIYISVAVRRLAGQRDQKREVDGELIEVSKGG